MFGTERLQAFTDGVLAIIITVMVLELSVPHKVNVAALRPLLPVLLSYALSFVYVGIYWNNHHHMFHVTERVNGAILWANLHLLFWLSLFPFANAWMAENGFPPVPTAIYGCVLFMAAIAWWLLQLALLACQPPDSLLAEAVRRSYREKISPVLYIAAIGLAFVQPWIADAIYVVVALIWVIPDRRIERALAARERSAESR